MPVVGSTVGGKYRIDRAIGAGGMGTVVRATHIELGAPVALKFLNEKIRDSASSRERFTREARASAQLRSEHVCRVSDFGIEDGVPYIAMELLEGIDLARLLDSGPVEVELAIEYVLQACIGLAEAHGLGIVHRDLKPSNLFLAKRADGSPLVKVLDFGIAKIPVDGERALTQTAHVIGSPGYMAPEQLRSSRTVDSRADVWALGVILYELISSRHPFHASAVTEIAVKIAMDDPGPLPEAPPALRDVIMRCLAKDPKQRYAEVGALAAALAPLAPRGSNAAVIANRFLTDAMENRRTIPRVEPETEATENERSESPTVRAIPPRPDPAHRKPVPKRSSGLALGFGIGAVVAAALVVVLLFARGSDEQAIALLDPVVVPAPTPRASDATVETPLPRGILDITVTGVVVATIIVDGVEWGLGQRISREVSGGPHEIEIRAPGKDPVQRSVDGPGSITIDVSRSGGVIGYTPPPITTPTPAKTRPPGDPTTVNSTLALASSRMLAKGLLTEDVPNSVQLREQAKRAANAGDLGRAQRLADQLLAAVDAIRIDKAFIETKVARLNARIGATKVTEETKKQLDDLLADVMQRFSAGEFVSANLTLSVIAGMVARAQTQKVPDVSPRSGEAPQDPFKKP